jgi:hypothetical protein
MALFTVTLVFDGGTHVSQFHASAAQNAATEYSAHLVGIKGNTLHLQTPLQGNPQENDAEAVFEQFIGGGGLRILAMPSDSITRWHTPIPLHIVKTDSGGGQIVANTMTVTLS